MKSQPTFLLSTIFLIILGCHNGTNPPTSNDISGFYHYTAYDTTSNVVVTGTMRLTRQDSLISGERNLTGNGREAGSGPITGSIDYNRHITILFPSQHVGSIYIVGTQSNSTIAGDRYFDTGSGPAGRKVGTFQLVVSGN